MPEGWTDEQSDKQTDGRMTDWWLDRWPDKMVLDKMVRTK